MDKQRLSCESISSKNLHQTLKFKGIETCGLPIIAQNVSIDCSPGNHNHGSSKVKLKNIVDYSWEQKYYIGHLLAVHVSGKCFAYAMKGKGGGMVRVASLDSSKRALIKEFTGNVQDIAFAHIIDLILLACVDDEGNLFVYGVEEKSNNLVCTLHLHVVQDDALINSTIHRVVWCPYLPEDEDSSDDGSKLLVLTHGNKAELINVAIINTKHGTGPLSISQLREGYLEINEHTQPIMDAAFSPDGTAVATASIDGFVKFFQIYMLEGTKPRCLHEWKPHKGKPLSWLAFLDNHNLSSTDDQFWKFAITGCNNNTEIKIWSCESWTCLQTIVFNPNPVSALELNLKARLDLSAEYLFISDINNRILYILEMYKDIKESNAFAKSISEFLLPAPVLSFAILEAAVQKFSCSNSTEDLYSGEEMDDYEERLDFVAVCSRLYVVQPKRLQECQIMYQSKPEKNIIEIPERNISSADTEILSEENLQDIIPADDANLSSSTSDDVVNQLNQLLQNELPKLQNYNLIQSTHSQSLNLMTPDAFSSPGKTDNSDKSNSSPNLIKITSPSQDKQNSIENALDSDDILTFEQNQKDNFASGGSSPSREVQEILSLNKTNFNEYYETEKLETEPPKNEIYDHQTSNLLYNESNNINSDGWPNIPMLKAKEVVNSEEKNNMGRLVMQDLNSDDNIAEPLITLNHNKESSSSNTSYGNLEQYMISLIEISREHRKELEHLQNEIKSLKITQEKHIVPDDLENILAKQLDLAFARNHAQQAKMFDSWANARMAKDKENQDTLALNLSHIISKQINEKLQAAVNVEMKQTVLPIILGTLENLKHFIHEEFTQKNNIIDQIIRENLNKFITSKTVTDSLSITMVNTMKPTIEKTFKEAFTTTLLPSWDKIINNMFQQLNDIFYQGTKEYTQSLENYMDKTQKKSQDKCDKLLIQMQTLCDNLKSNSENIKINVPGELNKQMMVSFASLQDNLNSSITELIQDQIASSIRNHASVLEDSVINAVRSRAVTPSPNDTQVQLAQIQNLLAQGLINSAFQQALSASDLQLVVYICEKLNPQMIFGQSSCPLQQHVLLSLIQQLSADMANHTELKTRYLEEAVLNLDPTYPVTKEHMSTVLRELLRQLTAFIQANPNHKIIRNLKMLQMAAQSLLKI